jgi:hypothetical protein
VHDGEQLAPGTGRAGAVAEVDELVGGLSIPSRSASVAGSSSPACATARGSSKVISTWSSTTWEDRIEKCLRLAVMAGFATAILPGQEALFTLPPRSTDHPIGEPG